MWTAALEWFFNTLWHPTFRWFTDKQDGGRK